MFYEIFFSPQVKRCATVTYEHGIYELLDDLPNNSRIRLKKLQIHNHFHNTLRSFDTPRNSPPPQVNRHAPITHRHGTRKPPHEPQDPLGNITKSLKPHRIIAQRPVPPSQNANPGNTGKNLLKNRKQIFLVVRYFA